MGLAYCPWEHADRLGLTVIERHLPAHRRGEYWHDEQLIVLTTGLSHRAARSTLAHEVAHAIAGDRYTPFGPVHAKAEALACRRAALALINPVEYAAAEELRAGHLPAIAHELNVSHKVLRDWIALPRHLQAVS